MHLVFDKGIEVDDLVCHHEGHGADLGDFHEPLRDESRVLLPIEDSLDSLSGFVLPIAVGDCLQRIVAGGEARVRQDGGIEFRIEFHRMLQVVQDVLFGALRAHAVADLGVAHVGVLHLLDEHLEHDGALLCHLQEAEGHAGRCEENLLLDDILQDGNRVLCLLDLFEYGCVRIAFVDILEVLVLDAEELALVVIQRFAAVKKSRTVCVVCLRRQATGRARGLFVWDIWRWNEIAAVAAKGRHDRNSPVILWLCSYGVTIPRLHPATCNIDRSILQLCKHTRSPGSRTCSYGI